MPKILEYIKYDYNHRILLSKQSGFRTGYSRVGTLGEVTDSIFCTLDSCKISVLILLDYSKTFDAINHDILIAILYFLDFLIQRHV